MKRHEDLLKDTFHDGKLDALREATLNCGLAALRTRRKLRALRNGSLVAASVLLLVVALRLRQPVVTAPMDNAPVVASDPVLKIYPAVAASEITPVPTISDQELLALYANRSVGLVGKPGQQKLIFFDEPDKSVN